MSNKELFDKVVFKIISQIMSGFPDDVTIDLNNILAEDDCKDRSLRLRCSINSYDWLLRHGYIFQRSAEIGMIKNMVMPTNTLLAVMGKIPPALQPKKQTLWDFFVENAKAGMGSSIQQAVQMFLQASANLLP